MSPCRPSLKQPRNRKQQILSFSKTQGLYDEIGSYNRPEADIRQRHYEARAIRAHYYESCMRDALASYHEFIIDMQQNQVDLDLPWISRMFEDIMEELNQSLKNISRIFDEDSRMAQASTPDQYFVDNVYRFHIRDKGILPNGELSASYGAHGEPARDSWATIRGCDNSIVRHIILNKLLRPLYRRIYRPYLKTYNTILGRDQGPEPQELGGRQVDLAVIAIEATILVTCVAGCVAVLFNVKSFGGRIVATSCFNLLLPFVAVFFSKEAKSTCTLTLGFWAVMAVFVATAGSTSKYS